MQLLGRRRILEPLKRDHPVHLQRGAKTLVSFCCNNYLGLTHHAAVISAARAALEQYGAGSGASRVVSGDSPLATALENELALAKGTEAARVFGSGYLANIGVIGSLASRGDLIIVDRLIHASVLDAVRLSGAKWLRFIHNDVADCSRLLALHRPQHRNCLIITETVFSMDGDVAPISAIATLGRQYDAWVMTDDAHGLGVLEEPLDRESDIKVGTLSKAVGAYGGYVCGSKLLCDLLISRARSFIYTTALPPSVIAAATEALSIISRDKALCAKPLRAARLFTSLLKLPSAQSAIVPLIVGSEEAACTAAIELEQEGFLVKAIRPPTVPVGSSRLRFTFSASHEQAEISKLAEVVSKQLWFQDAREATILFHHSTYHEELEA